MQVKKGIRRLGLLLPSLLAPLVLLCGCSLGQKVEQAKSEIPGPEQTDLFVGGQGRYHTIRIPALITTPKGTVLAFAEGRKDNAADHGPHDIVLRRSLDGGKTWAPMQVIVNDGTQCAKQPNRRG